MQMDLAMLFQPQGSAIPVIDPELKALGRVWLPREWVQPSSGLTRYNEGHPYPPSLCLLFQADKCQAGVNCNQIHADRDQIAAMRDALRRANVSNCCGEHGDLPSARADFRALVQKLSLVVVSDDRTFSMKILPIHIAMTAYWSSLLESSQNSPGAFTRSIKASQICGLHQRKSCRFGVDCKHVHLCREQFAKLAPWVQQ
eukprot:RCo027478